MTAHSISRSSGAARSRSGTCTAIETGGSSHRGRRGDRPEPDQRSDGSRSGPAHACTRRSLAAVAAGGFDAVDIMVPHHLHEPVATEAFAAGLHVLLEKPMAPTLDACDRILAAAAAAGTVFMVAENAQYWPEIVLARELIEAGRIGDVITARACSFVPPLDEFYGGDEPWRFVRRGRRRRRGDRHRLALAAAAAHVARRDRRGGRRARPPVSREWRASRCAARCAGFDDGRDRGLRRAARTGPARPRAAVPHHRDERRAHDRGHRAGEALRRDRAARRGRRSGQLPPVLRGRARRLRRRGARRRRAGRGARGRARRAAGARWRCTDPPRPGDGRRYGSERRGARSTSRGAHVLVTGGTSGIGYAIARRVRGGRRDRDRHRDPARRVASTTWTSATGDYQQCSISPIPPSIAALAAVARRARRARQQRRPGASGRPERVRPGGVRGGDRDQPHRRVPARRCMPRPHCTPATSTAVRASSTWRRWRPTSGSR